jgi:hypothetical protein
VEGFPELQRKEWSRSLFEKKETLQKLCGFEGEWGHGGENLRRRESSLSWIEGGDFPLEPYLGG